MSGAIDELQTFWFPDLQIRGALVRLHGVLREVRARAAYGVAVATALGESLAAVSLFSAGLKQQARVSVQLQEAGALQLLFAEISPGGRMRGIARTEADAVDVAVLPFAPGGRMAITIETQGTDQRYQGVVALQGETLAEAFTGYFQQSEQLPTRLILISNGLDAAAGLLLQQMPQAAQKVTDTDGWNRLGHLLHTLRGDELLTTPTLTLLQQVFAEETVALTGSQPLVFACSCSRERVGAMLYSLGRAECTDILAQTPQIEITCEFCGMLYRFDSVEVESLFHPPAAVQPAPDRLM